MHVHIPMSRLRLMTASVLAIAGVLATSGMVACAGWARTGSFDAEAESRAALDQKKDRGCAAAESAWVGTFGYGLDCIDEAGWHAYLADATPLPSNQVKDVVVCPDGRTWVSHSLGVSVTNGRTWNHFGYEEGLSSPESVACDKAGGAWVAHYEGASHFDGKHWTTFAAMEMGSGDNVSLVRDVAVADDGTVWVVTANSVARYDGTDWSVWEEGQGFDDLYFFEAVEASPSGIWAAHSSGVLQWDGTEWLNHGGGDLSQVQDLAVDPSGNVWVATWSDGVSMFDGLGWLTFDRESGDLETGNVLSVAADGQGRIWAGTGYGLAVYDGEDWQTYHMHDSDLLDDEVYAVGVGAGGPPLPVPVEKGPGSLSGTVLRGTEPAAGLTVELCTEVIGMFSSRPSPCADHAYSQQVTIGADGRFSFADVPVGRYGIVVQSAADQWVRLTDALGIGDGDHLVEEGKDTDIGPIDLDAGEE